MADINKLVNEIGKLTMQEAADMAKMMEDQWGIQASNLQAAAPIPVAVLEERVASLEGRTGAVATASGTVNLTFATGVLEGGELLQQQRQDLTGNDRNTRKWSDFSCWPSDSNRI